MNRFSEEDVIRCLDHLGEVAPSRDSTRRAIQRVREALQNEAIREFPLPRREGISRRVFKIAAVVLAAAGIFFAIGILTHSGSTLVFAQVVQKFRDAHTLAYQMSMDTAKFKDKIPLPAKMIPATITQQIYMKEPSRVRAELPFGQISIGGFDHGQWKILALNPIAKTAMLLSGTSNKQPSRQVDPMKFVEKLRGSVEKDAHPIGNRRIGGIDAQGFRVSKGQEQWLVWADPKTRLPIEIEITIPDGTHCTLSEFRFNPELSDDLFSLEVPKGYKLLPVEVEDLSGEENLVRMLRTYAKTSDGSFPKRLDDVLSLMLHLVNSEKKKADSPADVREGAYLVRSCMFIGTLKNGYTYRPNGAKLGEATKPLFWYRPDGSTKWRALYADLHWAELTADQLPEKPVR